MNDGCPKQTSDCRIYSNTRIKEFSKLVCFCSLRYLERLMSKSIYLHLMNPG